MRLNLLFEAWRDIFGEIGKDPKDAESYLDHLKDHLRNDPPPAAAAGEEACYVCGKPGGWCCDNPDCDNELCKKHFISPISGKESLPSEYGVCPDCYKLYKAGLLPGITKDVMGQVKTNLGSDIDRHNKDAETRLSQEKEQQVKKKEQRRKQAWDTFATRLLTELARAIGNRFNIVVGEEDGQKNYSNGYAFVNRWIGSFRMRVHIPRVDGGLNFVYVHVEDKGEITITYNVGGKTSSLHSKTDFRNPKLVQWLRRNTFELLKKLGAKDVRGEMI